MTLDYGRPAEAAWNNAGSLTALAWAAIALAWILNTLLMAEAPPMALASAAAGITAAALRLTGENTRRGRFMLTALLILGASAIVVAMT